MLTDADIAAIHTDFGTLHSAVACTIKRGTKSNTTKVVGAPYTTLTTHTCTVLTLGEVTDPFIESYARQVLQMTKQPRVILLPLPIPNNKEIDQGDYIIVGSDRFLVVNTGTNGTYQYQRVAYCQWVEGSTV